MGFLVLDSSGKTKQVIAAGATGSTGATGSQGIQGEFPKWNKHFGWVHAGVNQSAAGSDTNRLIHGFSTPASESGTISTVSDARNAWRRYTTGNVSGNNARVSSSSGIGYITHGLYCSWRVRMGSVITVERVIIATGSTIDNADVQTTTGIATIGFRYSTAASDTGFVPFVWDGVSQSTGTALSSVVLSTEYYLEVIVTNTGILSADFYVTKAGTARAGPTTLIVSDQVNPAVSVGKRVGPSVDIWTIEGVVKTIDVAGMWQNTGLTPFERATS